MKPAGASGTYQSVQNVKGADLGPSPISFVAETSNVYGVCGSRSGKSWNSGGIPVAGSAGTAFTIAAPPADAFE